MGFIEIVGIVTTISAIISTLISLFYNYIWLNNNEKIVQEIKIKTKEGEKKIKINLNESKEMIEEKIRLAIGFLAPKIFIAYSQKDKHLAKEISSKFEKYNLNIWFDQHIQIGENWYNEIAKAIDDSKFFVVLLSNNFAESEFANKEVLKMLSTNKQIFPILIDSNMKNIPTELKYLKYGDYTTKPDETINDIYHQIYFNTGTNNIYDYHLG